MNFNVKKRIKRIKEKLMRPKSLFDYRMIHTPLHQSEAFAVHTVRWPFHISVLTFGLPSVLLLFD
jgi:hypothetical protein